MWRKTRSQPESIVFRQTSLESLKADRVSRFDQDPVLDDAILEKFRQKVINDKAPLSCTGTDANRKEIKKKIKGRNKGLQLSFRLRQFRFQMANGRFVEKSLRG